MENVETLLETVLASKDRKRCDPAEITRAKYTIGSLERDVMASIEKIIVAISGTKFSAFSDVRCRKISQLREDLYAQFTALNGNLEYLSR